MANVTVVGGSPLWQRGIVGLADDGGHHVTVMDDLSRWEASAEQACVIVAASPDDLERISTFREEHRYVPLLAVLEEVDLTGVAAAIRAGATGVLGEHDAPELVLSVISHAVDGLMVLPAPIVASMARGVPDDDDISSWLSEEEVGWLKWMAAGNTVADLAEDIGYSERVMFRQLKSLYSRLGVANRTEALLWASRRGLLGPD